MPVSRSLLTCVTLSLATVAFSGATAAQCLCAYYDAPVSYEQATVVFVGVVAARTEIERGYAVTLDVSEVWKGEVGEQVTVEERMCLVGYRDGERYLVYAHEQNGVLAAGMCSRSRPASEGEPDLEAFRRAGLKPQ